MPCRDETHEHTWPMQGTLELCKCEIFCGYCTGDDAQVVYIHPWELRGHIRDVHARGQVLAITVSPRPPKPHVSTTSVKRKLTEVETSESEADEDSDEDEDDPSKDGDYEEGNSKGETKAKPRSTTKAPSIPVAGNDENTASSLAPLRLRAKPAAKAKRNSIKSHAASFKPVGSKTGPPSPKRAKQAASMGPPASVPMNNSSGLAPQMPTPFQLQYQQRLQDAARAGSAHVGNNVQAFFDHPRQNANNVQRPTGNVGLRSASMGPPTDNMGPSTSNMGPRPSSMGPRPGSMNPRPGNMGPPMNSRPGNVPSQNYGRVNPSNGQPMLPARPPGQNMPPRTASGDYYASHPNAIPPAQGPPNHQRIRNLTTHMLTHSNMSERSIIDHYQQEIEWVRQFQYTRDMVTFTDQIFGSVMQQVRQQFVDQPPDFVLQIIDTLLMRYGLIRPIQQGQRHQMGRMSGGSQSVQQQGGQVHGSRPVQQNVQQPGMQQPGMQRPVQGQQMGGQPGGQQSQPNGQRVFSGGQQPAPQQNGMQQPTSHPTGPQQHGLVDFGLQQPAVQRSGSQQPSALQGPSGQAGLQQSGQRVLSGDQQYDIQHVAIQQPDIQHVAAQQSTSQQSGQRVVSSGQPPTIEQLAAQPLATQQHNPQDPGTHQPAPEDLVPEGSTTTDPFPVLNSAHPSQQTSQEKPKSISQLASGVGLLPSPTER